MKRRASHCAVAHSPLHKKGHTKVVPKFTVVAEKNKSANKQYYISQTVLVLVPELPFMKIDK